MYGTKEVSAHLYWAAPAIGILPFLEMFLLSLRILANAKASEGFSATINAVFIVGFFDDKSMLVATRIRVGEAASIG